jgi:hypothetical protein
MLRVVTRGAQSCGNRQLTYRNHLVQCTAVNAKLLRLLLHSECLRVPAGSPLRALDYLSKFAVVYINVDLAVLRARFCYSIKCAVPHEAVLYSL